MIDETTGDAGRRRASSFFGRRKGKALRAGQRDLVTEVLPRLAIPLDAPPPADLGALFPVPVDEVFLEIGFGGGEHLLHEAAARPATGFIGVEPFVNGMAKMLAAIEREGRANIRLFPDDAALLLDWLPAASLGRVDLLYPDPWPKLRHHKRRFVSDQNLARIARVLRSGGLFRFATDIDDYAAWTLAHIARNPAFTWTARRPADWLEPWQGWPSTRYEAKARREGRASHYLVFRRA